MKNIDLDESKTVFQDGRRWAAQFPLPDDHEINLRHGECRRDRPVPI